ncbi:Colicin I receptor precursor [Sporomusa ovata DSM 2662]|uniref:Outer membrane vitamin B12 receptor BtuB n=1 Tax=Sporomusa ovata TaxID=2378 RepID=A0A0U1L2C9_9FIRM|nr:TonB-dependent receptor [Sporomusa ovata]EQB25139.1 TonB-dependent receptor [Sporomusa ovata DSM 2662]CQR73695.1 Outer membrane vitamin B12 receptor BtuB [Sporomusa ovata]
MHKKMIGYLAILNCCLLSVPGLTFATESVPEESFTLDEVIVTAIPLEKYLVTTSVITDKDIEAKGARNLADALEDVPGVNLHHGKKNNNTLDIRGSALSYTKIYIDGVLVDPLAKVSGGDVDLDMFPVSNIAKIEVIKGPAPVSYGTDAIGGMVLITTKNGKNYEGGKVSVVGGSNGTLNGSVSYGGGDEKFNYYINGGSEHTDGFMRNADRKSTYFNTKLNWKFENDATLTFTGGYSDTDKGCLAPIDPANGKPISYKSGFWPGLNNSEFRDWEKSNLSLQYAQKVNSKLDYNVKVYRFTEKNGLWANGADHDPAVTAKGYSTSRWNASYWDSTLNGVELQGNYKLNDLHTLTFGTLYNDIDWKKSNSALSDPYNYSWDSYNNKRYGYYVQDNFLPNEKTTITFGVRRDESEVTDTATVKDSAINPTINVVYRLDNNNTLRTSFGKTCSFPTVDQLYGTSGNPDLKPEKAKSYEMGLKHQFDKSLTGDIAIFKNDIEDLIFRASKSDPYKNVNYAKIRGVELELNKQFTNRLDGFINYTYLDTTGVKDDGTTSMLKYTPRNMFNYGVIYQADKGYKFRLTGHFSSERATWDDGTGHTATVKSTYPTLSSYHVMDLQIKRQINENQDWYITVANIFDKEYQDELFYPAAGRTVMVGADYKF